MTKRILEHKNILKKQKVVAIEQTLLYTSEVITGGPLGT